MPDTPGLRYRKKERTRRAVEQAALDLFERSGFDGTTIEEIAAAAEISPRTFFHYFPTKEDVVLARYSLRLDQVVAALVASPPEEDPWTALRGAFLSVSENYETHREELLRRFRIIQATPSVAARNLQVQASWESAVADAVAVRLGRPPTEDIRPRLIAGAALAAMRASLQRWLTDGGHSRLPDHVGYCFELLGRGLRELPATE